MPDCELQLLNEPIFVTLAMPCPNPSIKLDKFKKYPEFLLLLQYWLFTVLKLFSFTMAGCCYVCVETGSVGLKESWGKV